VTSPQGILLTVFTVWLAAGLLWRHWHTSEDLLRRLRTASVFCGVLLVVGFVLLPSVPISGMNTDTGTDIETGVEDALYAVNVPFLAFTEVYPPLWLTVLAGLLCIVGVLLSQQGEVRVLSLTTALASVLVFAVGWGWWLAPLTFTAVTVSQGAVVWLVAVSVVVIWRLSRRAEQRGTVFFTWTLLVASWLWLGLTSPGVAVQMPGLAGYYTWLEPAASSTTQTVTQATTQMVTQTVTQTVTNKQLAYGGWLLVAVAALSLSIAVAGVTLTQQITTAKALVKTSAKRSGAKRVGAKRVEVKKDVWLEGTSLALFVLICVLALRYVVTLDTTLNAENTVLILSEDVREQTVSRLLDWRSWLRIVPPYSLQMWLVATLQTGAVALVARTLGWLLQRCLLRARRGFRRVMVQVIRGLRVLLVVGFVVAWWLVWQPVAVIGLLALVALLDSDIQPTVVRSVLLGVLLGQGLGELILASLQAGSGLGLLTIVVALWGLQWGGSRLEMHFVKRAS
jgi:hypothetical protein